VISVILMGSAGRMGQAIEAAAAGAADLQIKGRVDRSEVAAQVAGPGGGSQGYQKEPRSGDDGEAQVDTRSALEALAGAGDVVVDFSAPEGALAAAQVCASCGAALVTGTTGLSAEAEKALAEASTRVAVLRAANFSLGLLAMRRAVSAALDVLGEGWDVEIVERHHRRKADSPSGTALLLAGEVAARRGLDERVFRCGREGRVGPRTSDEIGIHAVRGGSWIGDHTVLLASEGESIELRHVAQGREAFARGVLEATRFVAGARPGMYHLEDVLTP